MKVLHVIPALAPRYGGPSTAALTLCRALGSIGVRTTIASTDADGLGRLRVPLGTITTHEGVEAIFFRRRLGEAFKWSAGMSVWLGGHVREFDLVHVHAVFSHASLAAGRACRDARVPYLVRPLGTLDPWSLDRKRARKKWLLRWGGMDLLTGATALHYTSEEEKRLAETALPGLSQGIVVPLGVDEAAFQDASPVEIPPSDPVLLSMSRLDPKKGIDLLIAAFHAIVDTPALDRWRLVIAGEGDPAYAAQLEHLAANGPAAARIEFRGWVDGSNKVALLRSASLFALPSSQENFGLSLAEALASGVPAIVTPGVNLAGDIEEAGAGWVAERSVGALADGLRKAAADVKERQRRGAAARRWADRFRWPVVAQRLSGVYRSLLRPAVAAAPTAAGARNFT